MDKNQNRVFLQDYFEEAGRGNIFEILTGGRKKKKQQPQEEGLPFDEFKSKASAPEQELNGRSKRDFTPFDAPNRQRQQTRHIASIAMAVLQAKSDEEVAQIAADNKMNTDYMIADVRMFLRVLANRYGAVRPTGDVIQNFRKYPHYWLEPVRAYIWMEDFKNPDSINNYMKSMFRSLRANERHDMLALLRNMMTENA